MLRKIFRGNWTRVVTVVGIMICFFIIFSGTDAMYVLVVLGAVNILYGLYSILTGKPLTKNQYDQWKDPIKFIKKQGICQIAMGIFVLAMGIIYVGKIIPATYFYDILLAGIIILMVIWFVLHKIEKK